ncbi:MAG: hypothetical protein OXN88_18255 [Chloroflexota bacterium]|nr:hypothetical protein [Chloroflexota bacterium]
MPTIHIELSGLNCRIVENIFDAAFDELSYALSKVVDTVYYSCEAQGVTSAWGEFHPGIYSPRPSVWLEVLVLYVLSVIMLFAALYILWRKGASPRDVFYWGAFALIVPFLGPMVTLIFYRFAARNHG